MISSSSCHYFRPSAQAIETIRVVERGLRESGAIDTEALCIVAGEKVWAIKVTINIIDDDGNINDACGIAAITALHHFRRPDVSITAEGIVVVRLAPCSSGFRHLFSISHFCFSQHPIHERTPVPLSIHHMPIAVSFAAFEQGDSTVMLVDPSWKEEKIAAGKMTITLNAQNELCAIQKAGGVAMLPADIIRATKIAATKVGEISQAVSAALKSAKFEALEPSFGIGLSQLEKNKIEFKRGSASVVMPSSEKFAPSSVDMSDFRDFAQRLQKEHDRKDSEAKEKADQFLSSFKM